MRLAKPAILSVILFLVIVNSAASALAQTQTYWIPLGNSRWNQYEIGFNVPSAPKWAHDTVLMAMEVWNEAQEWFKATYYPNGRTYEFREDANSQNKIIFQNSYSADYVGLTQGYSIGQMTTSSQVTLVLVVEDGSQISQSWFLQVSEHELGHVLGLGHVSSVTDLMCAGCYTVQIPSTLDLYAVHVIADGSLPQSVTLPSTIPFKIPSLPHFQIASVGVIVNAPPGADITLDNQTVDYSYATMPNASETHTLDISDIIQLDSANRLKFDSWGEMFGAQRTITFGVQESIIPYNVTFTANYHSEHFLNCTSQVPLLIDGCQQWYQDGSTANFSASQDNLPMNNILGVLGAKWQLDGWYENGTLLTNSTDGSVNMNQAWSLELRWTGNYTMPLTIFTAVLATVALAALTFSRLRSRSVKRYEVAR